MEDMKSTDGTIYPRMRIAQVDIGELEISAMAFTGRCPESPGNHVRFAHNIEIRDACRSNIGWGSKIFEGSLAELIVLVREANLAKEKVENARP